MDALFGLLVASLLASATFLVAWTVRRERTSRLRALAAEAGITDLETRTLLGLDTSVAGRCGRLSVRLEPSGRSDWDEGIRIVLSGLGHGPFGLTIRPEGAGTAFEKVFDGGEIVLGDPGFDAAAYVQGEAVLARAVLGSDARRSLQELLGGSLRLSTPRGEELLPVSALVAGDELTVDVRRPPSSATGWLKEALSRLTAVADSLAPPADVPAALAAQAKHEPLAAVRLGSLRLLARRLPGHEATLEALRTGCMDEDPEVRLEAALALGEEGHRVLHELAASNEARDEHAARAIQALGMHLPLAEAIRILGGAVAAGRSLVVVACARLLGKAGDEEAGAAEPALIEALVHRATEVRAAVAEALGRLGSPRAVLPLHECAEANPLDLAVRRATREAIALIQSRVEGGEPGQLSLAGAEAGQLSLAEDDPRGRLSLEAAGDEAVPSARRAGTRVPAS